MSVLLVSYDLDKPHRDYSNLTGAIEQFEHCHSQGSVWVIDSSLETSAVYDRLKTYLDRGDVLFVIKLRKRWTATKGAPCNDWLNDSSRSWD